MSLDELEKAFRDAQIAARVPQVVLTMHIAERDIRVLKPRLEAQHMSLSEHVRALLHRDAMPVPMLEVR